jgi:tyrosyl-tRNA synthetase
MPDLKLDGEIGIIDLVVKAGFASSTSEARRLVQQGGVKINDEAVTDVKAVIAPADGMILKVGKRKFARIVC